MMLRRHFGVGIIVFYFVIFFPLIYTLAGYSVRSRNLVRPLMEQQCSALVMLEVCRGITGFLRL